MPQKRPRLTNGWSRVTEVLSSLNSAWLQWWWRSKGFEECDRVRDEATTFGKEVHKRIEDWLNQETARIWPTQEKPYQCAINIIQWLKTNNVKPLEWEVEVKDSKLKLVGHFDLLAQINGEKVLIDYKTSKKIDKSYALQLAAYAYLVKKTLKIDVNKGIILRVDKETGELEVKEYENLKPFWLIFKAGYTFYRFMNGK